RVSFDKLQTCRSSPFRPFPPRSFLPPQLCSIELPPLRDRQDDIPLLSAHFLQKFASRHRRPTIDLTAGAVNKLLLYKWPGNVRELQNVIERSIVMSNKRRLEANDILLQESGTGEHSQNSGETFKQFK